MNINEKIVDISLLLLLGGGFYCFHIYRKQLRNNAVLQVKNEKLRTLNESKNQLLSVLSHDLRPSIYRLGTIGEQIKEAVEAKRTKEFQILIQQNRMFANNAYSFLDNMLQWVLEETKQSFFNPEKLHLQSLTEQVAYHLIPFMELKKITLIKKIAPAHFIEADANTLKIALRNILENAVKYSPEHGTITIRTHTEKDRLQLVIADNGPGMEPETLQNIFNPHKKIRKKDSYGHISAGLGMHLVKTMVEKNGSTLTIESAPGKGAKVSITFKHTKI